MRTNNDLVTLVMWWDGPYTLGQIQTFDRKNKLNGNGLYLLVGRGPRQKRDQIKYCGITERLFSSRFKGHHKLDVIKENCGSRGISVWLGKLEHPKRCKLKHLRAAEKIIIYSWHPEYNELGRVSLPTPTCLVSRWFDTNWGIRRKRLSFLKDVPDVIWYDGANWRTGNLKIREP